MPRKKTIHHKSDLYHVTLVVLSVSILIIVSILSFWNAHMSNQMRMEIQQLRKGLQQNSSVSVVPVDSGSSHVVIQDADTSHVSVGVAIK